MYWFQKKLLFRMDPEDAHDRMIASAQWLTKHPWALSLASAWHRPDEFPELEQDLLGRTFPNPLGLAAGMDKNGEAIDFWRALGFGFVEVGAVTPSAQVGNDRPRMQRLVDDEGLINRMGFNNKGVEYLLTQLLHQRQKSAPGGVLGVNIGKGKDTPLTHAYQDYLQCYRRLGHWVDFVTLNVSSPNTKSLRDLQTVENLRVIVQHLKEVPEGEMHKPALLVKVSPDLPDQELEWIAEYAANNLDGIIATNTTTDRPHYLPKGLMGGGLSGSPLRDRAHEVTRLLYRTVGRKIPIIGVGGIHTWHEAAARMEAGASLLQIYTGLVYQGPKLIHDIVHGLAETLRTMDMSLSDLIGRSAEDPKIPSVTVELRNR